MKRTVVSFLIAVVLVAAGCAPTEPIELRLPDDSGRSWVEYNACMSQPNQFDRTDCWRVKPRG